LRRTFFLGMKGGQGNSLKEARDQNASLTRESSVKKNSSTSKNRNGVWSERISEVTASTAIDVVIGKKKRNG